MTMPNFSGQLSQIVVCLPLIKFGSSLSRTKLNNFEGWLGLTSLIKFHYKQNTGVIYKSY